MQLKKDKIFVKSYARKGEVRLRGSYWKISTRGSNGWRQRRIIYGQRIVFCTWMCFERIECYLDVLRVFYIFLHNFCGNGIMITKWRNRVGNNGEFDIGFRVTPRNRLVFIYVNVKRISVLNIPYIVRDVKWNMEHYTSRVWVVQCFQ